MHFESMNAFWQMGGYGLYVWLSFAMATVSVAWLWLDSIFAKHQLFGQVLREQARQRRIKAANVEQPSSAIQADLVGK